MPLNRAPDPSYDENMDGVAFAMLDQNNKRVVCRVSSEALVDRGARDKQHLTPLLDLFKAYRLDVERIASKKYDAGDAKPIVTSADLAG